MPNRDWNRDGRCITPEDARQVVECYRAAYSANRFRWLMELGAHKNGHPPEVSAVFKAALAE